MNSKLLICLCLVLPVGACAQPLRTTPTLSPVPVKVENKTDSELENSVEKVAEKISETKPAIDLDKPAPHIALILPLAASAFASVAESVKLGFLAGAKADEKNAPAYRIVSVENETDTLAAAYQKALKAGAVAVVAGITRDGASRLAKEAGRIPALSLNAPTIAELPMQFYFASLSVDVETRQVARLAWADGSKSACLLVSSDALSKRIEETFAKEWHRLGGEVVAQIAYNGDANAAGRIRTEMEKLKCEMVFLAANTATARLARPYLPMSMPVYATSQINDARAEPVTKVDLEDVRFLEMPWFVEADHPAVMAYAKPELPMSIEQERLYALGLDAWRLVQVILKGEKKIAPLDGVTGRLTLDGHEFVRTLTAVQFHDGKTELLNMENPAAKQATSPVP